VCCRRLHIAGRLENNSWTDSRLVEMYTKNLSKQRNDSVCLGNVSRLYVQVKMATEKNYTVIPKGRGLLYKQDVWCFTACRQRWLKMNDMKMTGNWHNCALSCVCIILRTLRMNVWHVWNYALSVIFQSYIFHPMIFSGVFIEAGIVQCLPVWRWRGFFNGKFFAI
jgi:hypothetical protein